MLCRWDGTRQSSSLELSFIPLGLILGLIGTFLDSLLGATCQYTGFDSQLGRVSIEETAQEPSPSALSSPFIVIKFC